MSLHAAPAVAPWPASTDRIIIKYRADAERSNRGMSAQALARASERAGMQLGYLRKLADGAHVVLLPEAQELSSVKALVRQLARDPAVL